MSNSIHQDYINSLDQENAIAYKANLEVFKGGKTKFEIAQYYNEWAEQGGYDLHLSQDKYSGPEACVHAIAAHFTETERTHAVILDVAAGTGRLAERHLSQDKYSGPEACVHAIAAHFTETERTQTVILDVAAGTGRLGEGLYNLGFHHLDALDPSEGMLKRARDRGVYTNFINDFVDVDNPIPVTNGYYDGIGCSGGFGEGHIPCAAVNEFIRAVKSGGVICIAMREEYLEEVTEYKNTFHDLLSNLEVNGVIRKTTTAIPNYAFGKRGILFTIEKL